MKTNFFITASILLSMIFSSFVQAQTVRDSRYEEYMQLALNRMDSAKTVEGLQQARNLFDRISKNYVSEWLPAYYVAYCDVNSVFYDLKSPRNGMILEEANKVIEDMEAFKENIVLFHLHDNDGAYNDSHWQPGYGNTPWFELFDRIERQGYKDVPGSSLFCVGTKV